MPTYEYACTSCGQHVEAVQKFTDDPLSECPHCGGPLRKVFGSIGIVLKGSGFYKNDSRTSQGAKSLSATSSSSDGGGESTTKESASKDGASTTTPASTSTSSEGSSPKSEPAATPKAAST
jgi:putative FmdB family regulatory protein